MKKPFLHALAAAAYIVIVVSILQIASYLFKSMNGTFFIPMEILSIFVLSAAIMGYIFLSEPFYLFMDNRKQEAVAFFGKTVGFFACFVALFAILLFIFK